MGTPPEGVTIDSITLDKKEATITGNEEDLNTTEKCKSRSGCKQNKRKYGIDPSCYYS